MAKLTYKNEEDYQLSGVRFGGEHLLDCSACGKPLVKIVVTRPDEKDPCTGKVIEWKLKAKCCYCDDHSFEKTIHGGWTYSGIFGKDQRLITEVKDMDFNQEKLTVSFIMVKSNG